MRHLTRMSRNLSRWGGGFTYLYLSLMLLCFCAIGVKAADTNGSVQFNPGVRYSQWAINSRAHDFYGNQKKFGFDYYDNNGNKTTTGNIFSYTFKTSENAANTSYNAEGGGTVILGAENKVDTKNGYKLDFDFNKSGYIKITLSGTKLQEGDIIKISAFSSTAGKGGLVAYTGTTEGPSSVSLGNMSQKSEDISYTVKASDILNGLSTSPVGCIISSIRCQY